MALFHRIGLKSACSEILKDTETQLLFPNPFFEGLNGTQILNKWGKISWPLKRVSTCFRILSYFFERFNAGVFHA